MSGIEFVNLGEVLEGMKKRTAKLESISKVARQMGVLACNEIHPLTAKKTNNWDNSIHAEVHDLGKFRTELWVGSKGAFNGSGYNYGARQERINHPIEMGWHKAKQAMKDHWNRAMHGIASRTVTDAVDEFATMGGF